MKNKARQILLHITGCIAFLSLPVLLSPDVSWSFDFVKLPPFQEDFISYTLLLLFFYLNYFLLIPKQYFRQKYFLFLVCILASYAVIEFLPHVIIPDNHVARFQPPPPDMAGMQSQPPPYRGDRPGRGGRNGPGHGGPPFSRMPYFEYLFQFIIVLVLSAMIRINNRLKQSEKEKVNAELSYLKAQINPHFLFNTLNSIYSSAIDENADNTATAVVKLSGMMRYVISEAHNDYVSLEKEINYISDYIELQKIRLGNTVRMDYHVAGNAVAKKIAPLILISFIENAFKHGVNPEEKSEIDIDIDVTENILNLMVKNNKVKTVNGDSLKTNVGLENTTNRLQLLYPSKHELTIKNNEKEFIVMLKMNLQ